MEGVTSFVRRRALIVEDDPIFGEWLRHQLAGLGLDVDRPACSEADALASLRWNPPDLILLSVRRGGPMDGFAVARQIRSSYDDLPIVFVANPIDDAAIEEASRLGPFGFVFAPSPESHVLAAIAVALHRLDAERRLRSTWEVREASLLDQASRDPLTGVWNRRRITEILDAELARADREQLSLAVLMIDADGLKQVNDRCGHAAGDVLLRELVARIATQVRPYDALGRLGGDEFLLIRSGRHDLPIDTLVERITNAVQRAPVPIGDTEIPVRLSIGWAVSDRHNRRDRAALMAAADAMLYDVKRAAHEARLPGGNAPRTKRSAASKPDVLFKAVKNPRPDWPSDHRDR
jgi:diguanylate cyclase (GGDEF)-like protein